MVFEAIGTVRWLKLGENRGEGLVGLLNGSVAEVAAKKDAGTEGWGLENPSAAADVDNTGAKAKCTCGCCVVEEATAKDDVAAGATSMVEDGRSKEGNMKKNQFNLGCDTMYKYGEYLH